MKKAFLFITLMLAVSVLMMAQNKNEKNTVNGHKFVELAGLKWAKENLGRVNNVEATATDAKYGYYYKQNNAVKAAKSWGGAWRLPTKAEWQKLIDECDWTWKKLYVFGGRIMAGYIVSDKKDSSKYIFLPAAGIYDVGSSNVYGQGNFGYYWSTDFERYLYFLSGDRNLNYSLPNNGMTVRPVSE